MVFKDFLYSCPLLLILLISTGPIIRTHAQQTLTWYREAFPGGEPLELNVDNCTSSFPSGFLENILHGNFTVKCALFYDRVGCTGNSVEIEKTHHASPMNWKLEMTKSIGPCHKIHAETGNEEHNCAESMDPMPVVELFEDADFKGRVSTITLDHWTCFEVPAGLKRKVSSIRMKSEICVELHSKSQCLEDGQLPLRFRKNAPPTAINLVDWGFDDKTSSISLCGLSCRMKQNASRISMKAKSDLDRVPPCPHITIYDEQNLTGNAKHIVLKEDCINLDGDWEGVAKSIYLQNECAVIHTHFGCEFGTANSAGWDQKQLGYMNRTELLGYNLKRLEMEGVVRSISRCIGKKPSQPLVPIFVLIGLFSSGVVIAFCVNCIVQKRDKKEREILIYHDKPS